MTSGRIHGLSRSVITGNTQLKLRVNWELASFFSSLFVLSLYL